MYPLRESQRVLIRRSGNGELMFANVKNQQDARVGVALQEMKPILRGKTISFLCETPSYRLQNR
jgi:hypothetical protein